MLGEIKNFKKVSVKGVNYYNLGKSLTVNMTYDDVTEDNYKEVEDFNCFTVMGKVFSDDEDLSVAVMFYIGNGVLHDEVLSEIEKVSDNKIAYKIIKAIEDQAGQRENTILAHFKEIAVEGNILNIYAENGEGFTVDFRLNEPTVGSIVG